MNLSDFINSLTLETPPRHLSLALRALWYDFNGDWSEAHETIQDEEDRDCARVHAYLHRKEGDLWNARYWYRTAGKRPVTGPLEDERQQLTKELLEHETEAVRETRERRASV